MSSHTFERRHKRAGRSQHLAWVVTSPRVTSEFFKQRLFGKQSEKSTFGDKFTRRLECRCLSAISQTRAKKKKERNFALSVASQSAFYLSPKSVMKKHLIMLLCGMNELERKKTNLPPWRSLHDTRHRQSQIVSAKHGGSCVSRLCLTSRLLNRNRCVKKKKGTNDLLLARQCSHIGVFPWNVAPRNEYLPQIVSQGDISGPSCNWRY